MRKFVVLALFALFVSPAFADDQSMAPDEASSPNCEKIAKACIDAGYSRNGAQGKTFWHDCMKPVLFGQQVTGVTIDAQEVKACRQFKIKNLQEQLDQLKKYEENKTS